MSDEYRIQSEGFQFKIIDDEGETVAIYKTAQKAKHEVDVFRRNDVLWRTARELVETAVTALMTMERVDSRTAHYWIREAAD